MLFLQVLIHVLKDERNLKAYETSFPLQDVVDGYRPLAVARSFDNHNRQIVRVPVRSKSLLSAFFVKQKSSKLKTGSVS